MLHHLLGTGYQQKKGIRQHNNSQLYMLPTLIKYHCIFLLSISSPFLLHFYIYLKTFRVLSSTSVLGKEITCLEDKSTRCSHNSRVAGMLQLYIINFRDICEGNVTASTPINETITNAYMFI